YDKGDETVVLNIPGVMSSDELGIPNPDRGDGVFYLQKKVRMPDGQVAFVIAEFKVKLKEGQTYAEALDELAAKRNSLTLEIDFESAGNSLKDLGTLEYLYFPCHMGDDKAQLYQMKIEMNPDGTIGDVVTLNPMEDFKADTNRGWEFEYKEESAPGLTEISKTGTEISLQDVEILMDIAPAELLPREFSIWGEETMRWVKTPQPEGDVMVEYFKPGQTKAFKVTWEIGENEEAKALVEGALAGLPENSIFGKDADKKIKDVVYTFAKENNITDSALLAQGLERAIEMEKVFEEVLGRESGTLASSVSPESRPAMASSVLYWTGKLSVQKDASTGAVTGFSRIGRSLGNRAIQMKPAVVKAMQDLY
ncbi:MAG TPA: hypothetical protein PKZ41_06420, partial [Candidatus Omnitrophota bacterium]|nr:hypothetical protein [Candidatus Omnitrophota bacterium]